MDDLLDDRSWSRLCGPERGTPALQDLELDIDELPLYDDDPLSRVGATTIIYGV